MFEKSRHSKASSNHPPFVPTKETVSAPRSVARVLVIKVTLLFAFVGIAARLAQVQIIETSRYQQIARQQYEEKVVLPAARGYIHDRNGNVLVSNRMCVSFAADPKVLANGVHSVALEFSRVFGKPPKVYLEKLRNAKRFAWLERQVSPVLARQVHAKTMSGIFELSEPRRLYHYEEIAGSLIGFTDIDNSGLSGIELQCGEYLRGIDGYMIMQRDGLGRARPAADYLRVEPVNGNHVFLTIDLVYQSVAEDKLKKGIEQSNAVGGLVVMVNPKTGEVLAVAQQPGVDPNVSAERVPQSGKLRAVTDMFEPGSVFKVVTAAAALENNLAWPTQKFSTDHGEYKVQLPHGELRLIKDVHGYDALTFQEAMELSSNIVMAKVSDLIGSERLYQKARDFGFGIETEIEYPGEARGELKRPVEWSGTTLNSIAYGYEVAVTPMQIVAAYAAVANEGILMKPTLVRKIVSESGKILHEQPPQPVRRVVSSQTAATLGRFFEGVVQRGTATSVQIEGIRIAGKTGTSRKYVEGRYETGSHTASFIGYFPVENPEVVCLVMLDNPRNGGSTGGTTAAPIFREIAEHIITTGQISTTRWSLADGRIPKPSIPRLSSQAVTIPDVCNLQLAVAKKLLEGQGLVAEVFGSGLVGRQIPQPGTIVGLGSVVKLLSNAPTASPASGRLPVPNLQGLSVRRALGRLAIDGLEARIQGSGIVVRQRPTAGDNVDPGSAVTLFCEPATLAVEHN